MNAGRDADHARTMHRLRKVHLGMLVVVLAAATVLVFVRGVNERGLGLIGVIAALVAFRWWQLARSAPPGPPR